MVRNRKRKSIIGMTDAGVMLNAVMKVIQDGKSIRSSAKEYGIAETTLKRYVL